MRIIFCHIEKCGGTSIHDYFKSKLDFYFILRPLPRHGGILNAIQLNIISKILFFSKGFGGHRIRFFEPYDKFGEAYTYMTIIREPLERYVSHCQHHIERGISLSSDAFINDEYFDNFMCKKICGNPSSTEAINILKKKNVKVFLLETQIGLSQKNSKRSNESLKLDKDVCINKNSEDIKLYEWVKENNDGDLMSFFDKTKSAIKLPLIIEKVLQYLVQELAYIASGSNKNEKLKRGY